MHALDGSAVICAIVYNGEQIFKKKNFKTYCVILYEESEKIILERGIRGFMHFYIDFQQIILKLSNVL